MRSGWTTDERWEGSGARPRWYARPCSALGGVPHEKEGYGPSSWP